MDSVIATGLLLIGLGFGLVAFASTFMLLACLSSLRHNLAPRHLRGRYQGTWGVTSSSGLILGPLLGTFIFSWSAKGLWFICGGLGIVSTLLIVIAARKKERESTS